MRLKKHHKYEILWKDTYNYMGWWDEEDIDDRTYEADVTTIGYFLKENRGYIIIVSAIQHNNDFKPYRNPVWIPKGFISKIRELEIAEKDKEK